MARATGGYSGTNSPFPVGTADPYFVLRRLPQPLHVVLSVLKLEEHSSDPPVIASKQAVTPLLPPS